MVVNVRQLVIGWSIVKSPLPNNTIGHGITHLARIATDTALITALFFVFHSSVSSQPSFPLILAAASAFLFAFTASRSPSLSSAHSPRAHKFLLPEPPSYRLQIIFSEFPRCYHQYWTKKD